MGPLERWGYVGFGLGQRGIMGGRRASEAQGCLGEGRVGLAPLLSHPSRALSFTSVSTVPILQRETERPRAVLPGRRPWQTLKPALPSPTPPGVSNSSPPTPAFSFLSPPELATTWTWDPRSWWDAAATSLSTDRMQPGSVKAIWTVRHTSVPSPRPPPTTKTSMPLLPCSLEVLLQG